MKNDQEALLSADAVEIFNANMFRFVNEKARLFCQKHNLAFTAGSDAHRAKFVGHAYLEIAKNGLSSRNNLSEKEVTEQIKNRAGQIKGRALNLFEKMENSLKVSVKDTLRYYYNIYSKRKQYEKEKLK